MVVQTLANLEPSVSTDADAALRASIGSLLERGLLTECTDRAYDDAGIQGRVARLAAISGVDLPGKLIAAGFTDRPWVSGADDELEQACSTCMYYEPHRRFCSLPELMLPVAPNWSCVLWRI